MCVLVYYWYIFSVCDACFTCLYIVVSILLCTCWYFAHVCLTCVNKLTHTLLEYVIDALLLLFSNSSACTDSF